jgi:hypothetical protein
LIRQTKKDWLSGRARRWRVYFGFASFGRFAYSCIRLEETTAAEWRLPIEI